MLKESFCLAIPKNHKLVSLDEIDLYELRDEPFISLTSDLPLYTSTLQLCKPSGIHTKNKFRKQPPSIMIDFIKRGMEISIIPEKTWRIKNETKIKKIKIKNPIAFRYINIQKTSQNYIPTSVALFEDFVVSYFSQL